MLDEAEFAVHSAGQKIQKLFSMDYKNNGIEIRKGVDKEFNLQEARSG